MNRFNLARRALLGSVVLTLTVTVAACGDTSAKSDGDGGLDQIQIAYTPVASAAPLALGLEKGIFEKHGIDLELVDSGDNSAAIAASVASGKVEAGLWTWASLAATTAAKVPVTAISSMDEGPEEGGEDFARIVALKSSGVTSLADLKGQQIAANSVGGLQEFIVREALAREGLTQEDVEVVPIPIVNMATALRKNQVPAVSITEPFLSELEATEDIVELANGNLSVMPGLPYTCVIMSNKLINDDSDLVSRFQEALQESMAYAREHEDEVRAIIPTYTGMDPALAEEITLPHWSGVLSVEKAQEIADKFHEQGFLEAEVDISTAILASK